MSTPMGEDWRLAAYMRRWDESSAHGMSLESRPVAPVILEPTPAQLARGERVLWIDETTCGGASRVRKAALANGWAARLSRSRILGVPKTGGALERRHRRLEVETVALRLSRGPVRAWFTWEFDVERARWSPGEGQVAAVLPDGRLTGICSVTITGLEGIIGWKGEVT